jgi:hypothetical protein
VTRLRLLAAVLAVSLAMAGGLSGTARASTAHPSDYHFFGCVGPGPSSFTAVKELLPTGSAAGASAFRIVEGGTGVFVVLYFGFSAPPGAFTAGILTTSCQVDIVGYGVLTFRGFLVPPTN